MGRPRQKPEGTKMVRLDLSPEEYRALQAWARAEGIPMSTLARRIVTQKIGDKVIS